GREVAVPERRQHLEQPGLVDAIGGLLLLSLRGGRRQRYSARSVRRSLGSSGGRAAGESIVSHVTSLPRPTRANATGRASQDRVAAGGADLDPKSRRDLPALLPPTPITPPLAGFSPLGDRSPSLVYQLRRSRAANGRHVFPGVPLE